MIEICLKSHGVSFPTAPDGKITHEYIYYFSSHFQLTFILVSLYPLIPVPTLLRETIAPLPCYCVYPIYFASFDTSFYDCFLVLGLSEVPFSQLPSAQTKIV